MAETKKLIPKRRFKEFQNADDWEQCKLNEYAVFFRGNGLSRCDITKDGEQECILYGNLYTDYGMIAEKVVYKTSTLLKNPVYSKQGDVLIPASDTTPTGLARATSIEKSGVLLGGDINIIRPYDEINGSCLSLAINANRKELLKLIKGTTVKHIYNSDIKNVYIKFPKSLAEQSKLVALFKNIDNLITLHQHKLEKIKSMKSAYLYEMFPAEGENRPKRRFKGFSDAWEQCKLQTIYNKIRNAFVGIATPYYVNEGNFYLESNNVKNGQINRKTEIFINDEFYLKQKDNWLQIGDIAMVQSGHVGHAAVIPEDLNNTAAHALIIFSNPKVDVNPHFLNFQYQTISYKKAIDKITTGNTIQHILSSEMKEFTVSWTNIEEQNKIGNFFMELDNLITLHQRKLDKLKNLKKAYLYEMFI